MLLSQPARAEPEPPAPMSAPAEAAPAAPVTPPANVCPAPPPEGLRCVPPLTPIRISIRTHLGSKISTSGQSFEFELAEPIRIDDTVMIPAGTRGVGEVVHAKKSGGSGASGELVLAARYLDLGERRLRLRSLRYAEAGKDAIGTVSTLNAASAASPIPGLALIGFFVKGKGIDLPEGTVLEAKTAEPYLAAPAPLPVPTAPAAPAPQPVSPPPEG